MTSQEIIIEGPSKGNRKSRRHDRRSFSMRNTILTVFAATGIFLSIAGRSPAAGPVVIDRVVAVVNNEIITLSDLQREEALRKNDATRDDRQVLEDMIDRKLQMAAAKRSGTDVTDKELADAVADIMKRNSFREVKQFEAALAKEGLTLEQYKTELREQMTLSRTFNKFVRAGIAVDEAEVRSYYERNLNTFSLPEEIRVRQIFFPVPDNATPAQADRVKAKASEVYEQAKKGEDFMRLVRRNSPVPDSQDGDLGFMQRDHMLPEIEAAARTLKPGEIAGPIQCAGGYHIIRLEEVRTPVRPFDKVKDEIMNTLYQQKLENTYRSWLQTLRSDTNIENRL
jgi:peptidyl-prolyl cis-trans isomerase SurA